MESSSSVRNTKSSLRGCMYMYAYVYIYIYLCYMCSSNIYMYVCVSSLSG